ncbi:MAG TPA: lactonase family protein [Vicinamibacterales bacterium]|nr:lactonase family protein [Vicinamibacterales bacterium]
MRLIASVLGLLVIASGVAPAPHARAQRLVYIGTYTEKTASKGIYAFRFDDGTGALAPVGLVAETPSPSFLTASANGRFVYAVNELQTFGGEPSGSVTAFAVDPASAKLTELNVQSTKGAAPCHLVLDKSGRFLAVANYSGGNYSLFPVGSDGRLQAAATVVAGKPADGAGAKALGHMVGFDAQNKYLITADKGLNQMLVFRFDSKSGQLTLNDTPPVMLPPGSGPRHYAFHPSGRWVFTINEQGATITTFAWDAKTGGLTARSSVPTRPAEVKTGSTAEIHVHKSGRFVYGSNRGHDSIAVFSVGNDGALTLVEYEPTRGQTPRNFSLDPSGRWLIAANQRSDTLAVFSIDQKTGALTPAGELTSTPSPVSILFME